MSQPIYTARCRPAPEKMGRKHTCAHTPTKVCRRHRLIRLSTLTGAKKVNLKRRSVYLRHDVYSWESTVIDLRPGHLHKQLSSIMIKIDAYVALAWEGVDTPDDRYELAAVSRESANHDPLFPPTRLFAAGFCYPHLRGRRWWSISTTSIKYVYHTSSGAFPPINLQNQKSGIKKNLEGQHRTIVLLQQGICWGPQGREILLLEPGAAHRCIYLPGVC